MAAVTAAGSAATVLAVVSGGAAAALAAGPGVSLIRLRLGTPAWGDGSGRRRSRRLAPGVGLSVGPGVGPGLGPRPGLGVDRRGGAVDGPPDGSAGGHHGWLAAVACVMLASGLGGVAGAVVGVGVVGVARMVLLRRRRAVRRRSTETDVAEACVAMSAELTAGVAAHDALRHAGSSWPDLFGAAAGAVGLGGDPVRALRQSAARPGAGSLAAVAAGWQVSERTGAGLAEVLLGVADSLRAEAVVRREAASQLASVRATSRLLAALPVVTLLLFSAGDGGPVRFLVGDPVGLACLVLAAGLVAAGVFWVDRMSRQVTRSGWES